MTTEKMIEKSTTCKGHHSNLGCCPGCDMPCKEYKQWLEEHRSFKHKT